MMGGMEMIGALLIGLASGMIGAISTGGGLISVPAVIFLGLSPVSAIATTRLSAISGGLASFYTYSKNKTVVWRYMPYFMVVSLVAGLIGPKLLLEINEDLLERAIGLVMLALLPILLFKKGFGVTNTNRRRRYKIPGLALLFLVMIYGTMFGAGGGIFMIYVLTYFFGLTVTEANATGTPTWLVGTVVALIAYIASGAVVFHIGLPLMAGSLIGGSLGARLALKKGVAWVKGVLVVVIVASSIKLIFF